jgi:hypothetical protein
VGELFLNHKELLEDGILEYVSQLGIWGFFF